MEKKIPLLKLPLIPIRKFRLSLNYYEAKWVNLTLVLRSPSKSLDVPLPSEEDLLALRYQFPKERYILPKNNNVEQIAIRPEKLGYAFSR